MSNWIADGKPVSDIHITDRGLQYGDGLFETIAIRDGQPRLWQYHTERLARGCSLLRIKMPADADLRAGIEQALAESAAPRSYAVVKIIVSAGSGARGYGRGPVDLPAVLFGAFVSMPASSASYRDGTDVMLCQNRLAGNSGFAGLKTLNRLEQVMARSEVSEAGLFEGLTMDAASNIICGTMSNVFFVRDNLLSTPPLDSCGVEGVMRRHVIDCLQRQGIETKIQHTTVSELENSDEVFLSNSQFGVMPVKRCETFAWPVGDVTRATMAAVAENGVQECRQ